MVNDKEQAISQMIVDYILSEREKLALLAPAPHSGLAAAAQETAIWFAGEEDYEGTIYEYLQQRFSEQPQSRDSIWFLQLAYARHIWPDNSEPSEIAKDLIEKIGLAEIASTPALDYLAIGSAYAIPGVSGGITEGFGYAIVVAYATDGNGMIVDRINQRRATSGSAPLQISAALRSVARKFITLPSADEAGEALFEEAQASGYATEGWQVRLSYSGSYARFPRWGETSVWEPEMADVVADQLLKDCPTLLRPDWQDVGIATGVKNHSDLGGQNFQTEFVVGWRIPFGSERPAHFPAPMDYEGNPVASDIATTQRRRPDKASASPQSQRRRRWWPFGS